MRFSTRQTAVAALAVVAGASSAAAQSVSSPLGLLNYLEYLLTPTCRATLSTLLSPNSTLYQCTQIPSLLPLLSTTNTSIIPGVESYLNAVCSAPSCSNATIYNASATVLSGCASDLNTFGVSTELVEIVFGAYGTAREVACLSTNNTVLTNVSTITFAANGSSANESYCVTSALSYLQTLVGVPLTNSFIDTLILGGNATAYQSLVSFFQNTTDLAPVVCNDCFAAASDIVLENYPEVSSLTFKLPASYANATNITTAVTFPGLYQGFCNVTVSPNATLPSSINETAFNTTVPFNSTTPFYTTTNLTLPNATIPTSSLSAITAATAGSTPGKKRNFVRWD